MLIDLKRCVAYICPSCTNVSTHILTAFNFPSKGKAELLCHQKGCYDTCIKASSKGNKYIFEIDCPICGDTHTFIISKSEIWKQPLVTYKCPSSGMDIFFIGDKENVKESLEENIRMYAQMNNEDEFDDYFDEDEESAILYEMVDCVNEMRDIHRLSCVCRSRNINMTVMDNCLVLSCRKCRRTKIIRPTEENLELLMEAESIVIKD